MSDYISKQATLNYIDRRQTSEDGSEELYLLEMEIKAGRLDDSDQREAAEMGIEVLSSQLVDEVKQHAKTAAENVLLRGEAARLREVLVLIEDESSHEDACITKINGLAQDALKGDTEPVGAQVREPVQWFAERMESQLRKNDHKGGWGLDQCSMSYLAEMMHKKSSKYYNLAGSGYSIQGFIEQLADIANYAMMQADRLRGINTGEQKHIGHEWYCHTCEKGLSGVEVTYDERHDERYGGCGESLQCDCEVGINTGEGKEDGQG